MVITLMETGQLNVSGIPNDRLLSYGILEVAKDVIRELGKRDQERLVAPVTLMPKLGN